METAAPRTSTLRRLPSSCGAACGYYYYMMDGMDMRLGSDGGAWVRDGLGIPVPEEEVSVALPGSYLGGLMAVVEEPAPTGPAVATPLPATVTST